MKCIHFKTLEAFNSAKIATDESNESYLIINSNLAPILGDPSILWQDLVFIKDSGCIWTHGKFYGELQDLSNLVTDEEFSPVSTAAYGAIPLGTLGTVNGLSLEGGNDIVLDLSLYKIVTDLPTENILDNKIYIVPTATETNETEFTEYLWTGEKWDVLGSHKLTIDLSDYLKTDDADNKYMPKSGSTTDSGSGGGASLSISQTGSFNNYGDNGLAFNAIRKLTNTAKYNSEVGSKFPLNAASFGVKDTGTTAFTHKKYDTFNKDTGAYSGARNTAVLVFSGNSGLLYAQNTGTANDVTDDMYKFVGVIDSLDDRLKVYSAALIDALLASLTERIEQLETLL